MAKLAPAEYFKYVATGEYPLPFPPPKPKEPKNEGGMQAGSNVQPSTQNQGA
ncbi:MAG: hypothetical protein FWG10_07985 [Eubacteriaceae bacterium]|nr:hypothetical protein [Eubacteriaceae bacterium]